MMQIAAFDHGGLGRQSFACPVAYEAETFDNVRTETEISQLNEGTMPGKNVLGGELETCSTDPMTGFYRDGCCNTGRSDTGLHVVCTQVSAEFLAFSRERGNDLSTPNPTFQFPGLQPGDRWCLCAARWKEAYDAGMAPSVVLEATHISALEFASLEELQQHAVEQ